jgi:hypothetical protein
MQDREGHVGAEQSAARSGRQRLAARPAPAAVALEQHGHDFVAGGRHSGHRGVGRSARDVVLRRAAAVENGDPHGVASGDAVVVGSGTTSGSNLPIVIVTVEPFGRGVSGAGS